MLHSYSKNGKHYARATRNSTFWMRIYVLVNDFGWLSRSQLANVLIMCDHNNRTVACEQWLKGHLLFSVNNVPYIGMASHGQAIIINSRAFAGSSETSCLHFSRIDVITIFFLPILPQQLIMNIWYNECWLFSCRILIPYNVIQL